MKLYKKKVIQREDKKPYLVRYTLFTCRYFSIKIHNILLSDHDCLHDHPWAFITFLLGGGYVEYTPYKSRVYGRFSLLYRPAYYIHRLEIHQPVWSLVITFKKVREWGFWTRRGFVPWYKYRATNQCE
jgi:hypothetical protein